MSKDISRFFPHQTSIEKEPVMNLLEARKEAFDFQFYTEGVSKFRRPEDKVIPWNAAETERFDKSLALKGMIFHPSHVGSTLLSRMINALPRVRILCEPESINSLLLAYLYYDIPRDEVIEKLRMIIECFKQRIDDEDTLIFKSTSWNVFMIDLFLEAYPDVPWIYIDRDTESAVDSSLRDGGGWVSWWHFPTDLPRKYFINHANEPTDQRSYVRNVIMGQRETAQKHFNQNSKLFRYPDFIDQFETDLLPHFNMNYTPQEVAQAEQMTRYESKSFEKVPFAKEVTS